MFKQAKKKLIRGIIDGVLVMYLHGLIQAEKTVQVLRNKGKALVWEKDT